MNSMPPKLREELSRDPEYQRCARACEGTCSGRITWEHCWEYKGKQIQARFAIIPLCWYHHLGAGLNKLWNRWHSINRMTEADEKEYSRKNWSRIRKCLNLYFQHYREKYEN
jgi:hypothetical protein